MDKITIGYCKDCKHKEIVDGKTLARVSQLKKILTGQAINR